jgi:cell shape-determining protein MreC
VFVVIGAMSLIIAFAALWLVSDARKRTDAISHDFLNTHIRGVRTKIASNDRKIGNLASELSQLAKVLRSNESSRVQNEKSLSALTANVQKVRSELDQLDQSIPPRYRVRSQATQSH